MTKNYQDEMFEQISTVIEETGKNDSSYDNKQKALDILNVLEGLLAYTIYTTCISAETVRDSCEESYVNIKKHALKMLADNPPEI